MDNASKLLDLCTCYTKLMVRFPQSHKELQKKEKEFLDTVADFEEAALPPAAKFLYAYVGLQKMEEPENTAKYLMLLDDAWNEGSVDAGLFLIEIHGRESRVLPEELKNAERSADLRNKLTARRNPHAIYIAARLEATRFNEEKPGTPERARAAVEALTLLYDLGKAGYCGFPYLSALWACEEGPGAADTKDAYEKMRQASVQAPYQGLFAKDIARDALFRLGKMDYEGILTEKRPDEGIQRIRDASDLGHAEALQWLKDNGLDERGDGSDSGKSPFSFYVGRKDKVEIKYSDEKSSEKPIKEPLESDRKNNRDSSSSDAPSKDDLYWDSIPAPSLKITYPEKIARDLKSKTDIEALLRPLDDLPGLRDIKKQVRQTVIYGSAIRRRREAGLNVRNLNLHIVFSGNPGTGKTTIARMLGQILYRSGILESGHVVETDRSDLIGHYVGQTTNWTKRACREALGGILFIDEAYSIAETPWYSDECIDTLVKFMEDHADEFMVITAGYPSKMDSFIRSNPGLRSRFQQKIAFRDYTFEEMAAIFKAFCQQYEYTLDAFAEQKLILVLKALKHKEKSHFANGRSVRNFFDGCIRRQALRIERDDLTGREDLMRLLSQDIDESEGGDSGGEIVYLKA